MRTHQIIIFVFKFEPTLSEQQTLINFTISWIMQREINPNIDLQYMACIGRKELKTISKRIPKTEGKKSGFL